MTASVVIATHNKPTFLEATLACLARQTVPVEVIVVDDASTPALEKLPGATRVIRREAPRHLQAARNLGIAAATGEIVLLMDDDCLVRDDYVAHHLGRHDRDPGCLVVGSVKRIHYNAEADFWNLPAVPDERDLRTFRQHAERLTWNVEPWNLAPCSNNASLARNTLLRVGGYDEAFFGWGVDDVELTYRLLTAGVPLLMDSAIWVYHQEHPRSTEHQAAEEARNLRTFEKKHGFWVYDPPPGHPGPPYYPPAGAWFHAQAVLREGEPAAIRVTPIPEPVPDPPQVRWPMDWIVGAPAFSSADRVPP
jgi:GT2 family glycosyltransferase